MRVDTPDGDFIDIDWALPGLATHHARSQESALSHTAAARWLTPRLSALLREYPQLIKRPLVVTADGKASQGFSDNGFKARFGVGDA